MSRDKALAFYSGYQGDECPEDTAQLLKTTEEECSIKKKKILKECQAIAIEGMPEVIDEEQIRRLLLRFTSCNASKMLDLEYSNKNIDRATTEFLNDSE